MGWWDGVGGARALKIKQINLYPLYKVILRLSVGSYFFLRFFGVVSIFYNKHKFVYHFGGNEMGHLRFYIYMRVTLLTT